MIQNQTHQYPITLNINKCNMSITLANETEASEWLKNERETWAHISSQQNPQNPTTRDMFNNISKISISNLANHINYFEANYISSVSIKKFFDKIGVNDYYIINIICQCIINPGSLQINNQMGPNSIIFCFAKSLSSMYTAYGDPEGIIEKIDERASQIEQVRGDFDLALGRFTALLEKSEKDWDEKINGFIAQASLKAPKTYWKERSNHHKEKAKIYDAYWSFSVLAIILTILLFPVFLSSEFFNNMLNVTGNTLFSIAEKSVIFATLTAVIVWWSRQLLRNARSHDHLYEDATERVTMIETYAALVEQGLQTTDLSIVLTALYRPALTGIIDDNGPTLPIEILMKTMADASGRKN